jgi:hypothetical protein
VPATIDPASTQSRRLIALEKAQRARQARAALKRQIAHGQRDVSDVLRNPPAEAETMTVGQLLSCQRGWGTVRTLNALRRAEVPEYKELRRLTDRQIAILLATIRAPG